MEEEQYLAGSGVRACLASGRSENLVEETLLIQRLLPAAMSCHRIQYVTSRQRQEAGCFDGPQAIYQRVNRLLDHFLFFEIRMSFHFRSSFSQKATGVPDQVSDCTREH